MENSSKITELNNELLSENQINLQQTDKPLFDTANIQPEISSISQKGNLVPIKQQFLQNFQKNIDKIKEILLHPNNPAYGGVQFLSPNNIWEKIHQTSHKVFTGNEEIIDFTGYSLCYFRDKQCYIWTHSSTKSRLSFPI